MPNTSPSTLRTHMRNSRQGLSGRQIIDHGRAATRNLLKLNALLRARRVACYMATAGEMDCRPLIDWLQRNHKTCLLPVLHPIKHQSLLFCPWREGASLHDNKYGIPEPENKRVIYRPRQIDVVILPLVAFDSEGHRLGMGGGYYDRSFSIRRDGLWRRPLLVGLAHDFQRVDSLTTKRTDVTLDYVVSELQIYTCNSF